MRDQISALRRKVIGLPTSDFPMNRQRFDEITAAYPRLRIAVAGDFCLDRYLEINPALQETSIETGLPVHNVVRVRAQPGGAGTILNNLVALGVGEIYPVGFCGDDGEGYELRRALEMLPGVRLRHFLQSAERRTFTYCKPLVLKAGEPPIELNRLDSKNWSSTPEAIQRQLADSIRAICPAMDGLILLDQVDEPETGVVTRLVRQAAHVASRDNPRLLILADSRRGLGEFPPLGFKMNAAELAAFSDTASPPPLHEIAHQAGELARRHGQPVFITLADQGIIGASATGRAEHVSALPIRGPIDVVGAGDAVMANLVAALAAGASLQEALQLSMAAASIVIHQLGTTGAATPAQIRSIISR